MAKNKEKKGGSFSKSVIVAILVFAVLFIIAVFVVFVITGNEPSTLIVSVFSIIGFEFGALGWIKTTEEKKEAKKDAEEQRLRERNTEKE